MSIHTDIQDFVHQTPAMNAVPGIQGETGDACQPSIRRGWISTSWPITARWIYLLTILLWSTDAIATGTLFDVYINDLARTQGYRNPNEFIGIMESSRGITCLIVALPLGYLFDKFDRLRVLRYAVLCFGLSGGFLLSIRSSVKIFDLFCFGFLTVYDWATIWSAMGVQLHDREEFTCAYFCIVAHCTH